jgi:hypothetical protein
MPGNDEIFRLLLDMGNSKENAQAVIDKIEELGRTTVKTAEKSAKGMGDIGLATRDAGRIIQDFAQGGFAGILNNIEGFVTSLGGGAGTAGLLTLVGTGLMLVLPKLREFVGGVAEETEKVKKNLEEIEAKVKATGEAMGKLKEAPTKGEEEEAKALTTMLKQRPAAAKAEEALRAGISPEEAMTAEGMTTKFGQLPSDQQLRAQAARAAVNAEGNVDPAGFQMEFERLKGERDLQRRELMIQARRQRAGEIVQRAQVPGPAGEAARAQMRAVAAAQPEGAPFREMMQLVSPEELKAQRDARREAEVLRKDATEKMRQDREMFRQQQEAEGRAGEIGARNQQALERRTVERMQGQIQPWRPGGGGDQGIDAERRRMLEEGARLQRRLQRGDYARDRDEARDKERMVDIMSEFSAAGLNFNQALWALNRQARGLTQRSEDTVQGVNSNMSQGLAAP